MNETVYRLQLIERDGGLLMCENEGVLQRIATIRTDDTWHETYLDVQPITNNNLFVCTVLEMYAERKGYGMRYHGRGR